MGTRQFGMMKYILKKGQKFLMRIQKYGEVSIVFANLLKLIKN